VRNWISCEAKMGDIVDLALGVVSAMGGFVDIGELIFLTQAGSKFVLSLMWVLVLGTAGVIIYSEMAGRLAAVSGFTVFKAAQLKLGQRLGWVALVSSLLVTLVTCAAELGGMALILELVTKWSFWECAICAGVLVVLIVAGLPFSLIENLLGVLGMAMLVFLFAIFYKNGASVQDMVAGTGVALHMDWPRLALYGYFAIGILTSSMMPYELVFYASGAIEEEWTSKQLRINRIICSVGFSFGFLVAGSLVINAAGKLIPLGIDPQLLGADVLQAVLPFGWWGGLLALFGMFFAITGAAVETSMSMGYMVCQFLDLPWGKRRSLQEAPAFHGLWLLTVVAGVIAVLIYQQPLQIAEFAVIFSVLALPLSYLAVWLAASDAKIMGMHVNGPLSRVGGLLFLGVLILAAVGAVPILVLTSAGQIW
jgi:manganese transport protein